MSDDTSSHTQHAVLSPEVSLRSDYDQFKKSYPALNFESEEGLLAFLLSGDGIKAQDLKNMSLERMKELKEVCAGMLSLQTMTVEMVLEKATELVSQNLEIQHKERILANTKFLLVEWDKLDLSEATRKNKGIADYKSNKNLIKLIGMVDTLVFRSEPVVGKDDIRPAPDMMNIESPPSLYSNKKLKSIESVLSQINTACEADTLNFLDIQSLSRELCNGFAEVYSKIKQDELYSLKGKGTTNLDEFDELFNQLTDAVEANILKTVKLNISKAKNLVQFYLKLAEACFDAGNLASAQAILAVLDYEKFESICPEVLESYKNKKKVKDIQAILLSNETQATEVDDQGNEIAHKSLKLRKYLAEKVDFFCMTSFSLEYTEIGNAANPDCFYHSLNMGKILTRFSKRAALVSANLINTSLKHGNGLSADYALFKATHPYFFRKGKKEGILGFLLSDYALKNVEGQGADEIREEQLKQICMGILKIKGMSVEAILDMANEILDSTPEMRSEEKHNLLNRVRFILTQWMQLDLSKDTKDKIGLTDFVSQQNESLNKKMGELITDVDEGQKFYSELEAIAKSNATEGATPYFVANENPNITPIWMSTVFQEIDETAQNSKTQFNLHIERLNNQLFNIFAEAYSKVKSDELYSSDSPNLSKFDALLPQVSSFVLRNILGGITERGVKNRISFYIELMKACFESGNLAAAQAILIGFEKDETISYLFRGMIQSHHDKKTILAIQSILSPSSEKFQNLALFLKKNQDKPYIAFFNIEADFLDFNDQNVTDPLLYSQNAAKIVAQIPKHVARVSKLSSKPIQDSYTLDLEIKKDVNASLPQTKIDLYEKKGVKATCQSILEDLKKKGELPFKLLLEVYLDKNHRYTLGSKKYTLLFEFIKKQLNSKSCTYEERLAAKQLLKAIENHAWDNGLKSITSQAKAILKKEKLDELILTSSPELSKEIKDIVNKLFSDATESIAIGSPNVNMIQKNKNYKALERLIKTCAPEERKALLLYLSKEKSFPVSSQTVSIVAVLLKKAAPFKEQSIKQFLKLFQDLKENDFFYKDADSMRKNKDYKVLVHLINKCTEDEKIAVMQFIEKQKEEPPGREADFIIDFKRLLEIDAKIVPPPPPLPSKQDVAKGVFSYARLELPSFVSGSRPIKILDIEASPEVSFETFSINKKTTFKFTPESAKTNLITNTKKTSYSIPPGNRGLSKTEENKNRYIQFVESVFEKINNSHSKMATLSLPEGLEDTRANMLEDAIQTVRMKDEYKNVYVKLINQKGEEVEKIPGPQQSGIKRGT